MPYMGIRTVRPVPVVVFPAARGPVIIDSSCSKSGAEDFRFAHHSCAGPSHGRRVFPITLALLDGSIPPRVEDPLPDSINLGFPLTLAGAASVFIGVLYANAPAERRDKRVRLAGLAGFWAGAVLYVLSLAVQVISAL